MQSEIVDRAESAWNRIADEYNQWADLGQDEKDTYIEFTAALVDVPAVEPEQRKFKIGDRVRKHSGSWWEGRVVGFYRTQQTPVGYCVQLDTVETGPVQIYPESALELADPTSPPLSREGEDSAEVERLTRPIAGIEHRTAQEVFDIMADRIRLAATRSGSAMAHSGGDNG